MKRLFLTATLLAAFAAPSPPAAPGEPTVFGMG
jgi:hypothetical protein